MESDPFPLRKCKGPIEILPLRKHQWEKYITGIKGKEMALVWHEKASRNALQTGSLSQTHTLLVQTYTHDYSQGKCRTMSSIIIKLK